MPKNQWWPPVLEAASSPVTTPTHAPDIVNRMQRVAIEFGQLAEALKSNRELSAALHEAQVRAATLALDAYRTYFD